MLDTLRDRKTAIVLGGTVPHIELINQLKEQGYYTVLIDYLPNCPAKRYADIHIQESTLDIDKVSEISAKYNADFITSGFVEHANITACSVLERQGKTPPYSSEKARLLSDKDYTKTVLLCNGIPTARAFTATKDSDISIKLDEISYPIIIKPACGNSSNGVRKAYNKEEALKRIAESIAFSSNHKALVEEYLEGKEVSAYCYVQSGITKVLMTAERLSFFDGEDRIIKCFSSIAPASISAEANESIKRIASRISKVFELNNTPFFYQCMVKGDHVAVIEFTPRFGGGMCFKTIKEMTGFDPVSAVISSWGGTEIEFNINECNTGIIAVNTIYGFDCKYDHIEVGDGFYKKEILGLYELKSKGDLIDNAAASSSRIAFFIVKAENVDDMLRIVAEAYKHIRVIDVLGHNVIRNDVNINSIKWRDNL